MRLLLTLGLALGLCGLAWNSQGAEPAVAELAAQLQATTPAAQHAAADGLADLGPAAAEAVPQLVAAFVSKDAELRWRVARALGVIGSPQGIEALRMHAVDENADVRAQSIFALGRLAAADKPSLEAITSHLTDPDANVRRASVRALQMIKADRDVVIPLVIKVLNDADPAVVMPALHAIAEAGTQAVPALTEALSHKDARYWACMALAEMGPNAKDAVPALTKVLGDERQEVRLQAVIALGEIGPAAKPAVPDLIKELQDESPEIDIAAVFALGRIGDPSAADAVAKLDTSKDKLLHTLATWTLAKLNPADKARMKDAVDHLVGKLGGEDREVAHMSARAIVELDPAPEILRPAMEAAMDKADPATAERIVSAYASLGPRVVPLAIKALNDGDAKRRQRALAVLGRIGPEAAPAVPDLVRHLKNEDPKVRTDVLFVLAAIGPKSATAVKPVTEALSDSDREVALTAGYCLGKIGPAAKPAMPELQKQLASEDKMMALTGVWALLQIGPQDPALAKLAVPLLTDALRHERVFIRVEAAMALGKLGKAADSALPQLELTSTLDGSPAVRQAAADAMKQIKG